MSRTAYLGTSDYAATVLRRLVETPHAPRLVITPPDRPRGRGRRPLPPPVAAVARELGLELVQAANVNEVGPAEVVRRFEAEVAVVCAFGQLIREPLLSEMLMLNVHPSLLPRWRGAAPIERAIMSGDAETGVSVMRVTAGLDSGPVALQEHLPIDADEDFGSLSSRLAELGSELLIRALDIRAAGELELVEQPEQGVTYAEKIEAADRRLDPALAARELARRVQALTPHIGAYLELEGGERLGVRSARADASSIGLEPGRFLDADGALLLGCGSGALALQVVQPAGGRPMPIDAFLRGHPPPSRVAET